MAHADWMSRLPESLRQKPMSEIAIPGTHNSGTSDISMDSRNAPDLQETLKKLVKYTCCVGKQFVVRWSVCQSVDLTAQMEGGIRYFDMRLAYDSKSDDYYLVHGLLSTRLREALQQFSAFSSAHPGEVLLIDFNHFYAMDAGHHLVASKMIMQYIGRLLLPQPYGTVKIPSVKECVDAKLPILLFYHASAPNMPFWNRYYIPSPWGNVNNVKKMLDFLEKQYKKGRSSKQFYVTQGLLTPDTSSIAKNPLSSLRSWSDDVNPAFVGWVKGKKIGPQGINICEVDFFQDYEVVPTILSLNVE